MNRLIRWIFCLAVATGVSSFAHAQVVDMSKITCQRLLSASPDAIDAAVWLSGYYNGLRKNTRLDLGQFKHNAEAVVAACQSDPEKTVMGTIDGMLAKKQ